MLSLRRSNCTAYVPELQTVPNTRLLDLSKHKQVFMSGWSSGRSKGTSWKILGSGTANYLLSKAAAQKN